MKLLSSYALACLAAQAAAATLSNKLGGYSLREHPDPVKRAEVQNYVSFVSRAPETCCKWVSLPF